MASLGVLVEIPTKFVAKKSLTATSTEVSLKSQIIGKTVIRKVSGLSVVEGEKTSGSLLTNFLLLVEIPSGNKELLRLTEIINVLGNGKPIRERAASLMLGKSILNNLAELDPVWRALETLSKDIPGFKKFAWCYAPAIVLT